MKFLRPSRETKLARQPVKSLQRRCNVVPFFISRNEGSSFASPSLERLSWRDKSREAGTIDRPPRWQIVLLISKDFRRLKKFRG